jgi:hypothetical protein
MFEPQRPNQQEDATMFSLGDELKDNVTGFTGVAIAKTDWLHQCTRWTLQPKVGKDGKIPETGTFDEPALVLVKARAVAGPKKEKTGGVQNDKVALRRH